LSDFRFADDIVLLGSAIVELVDKLTYKAEQITFKDVERLKFFQEFDTSW